jgi:diguanylate cyclase (GGDEF)-like protein/putative nucleotidyltransferase with HDIG domain
MTTNAKIYVSVLVALGLCVLAAALAQGPEVESARFASYLALAVFASILKVGMPALAGNMSFHFLFVLLGIVDLSLTQTLFIGSTSILIETLWRPKVRPTSMQVMFNLANVAVSIYCTDAVYRSPYLMDLGFNMPARLAAATTVFFIVNTFPNCAVISLSERAPLMRIWREQYFWSFPYYMIGGVLAFGFQVASLALGWQTALLTLPVAHLLYRTYSLYLARVEDGKSHAEELAALHLRTIEALALAIEAKDATTHDHLKRVQVYAMEIGRELSLSEQELEALRAAAVLHDIGKLAVPEYIISKPGRLTPEEFEKMKVHPVVGAEILEQVKFPYPVAPIVRAHHERWNGTGYPQGLRGNDIPIGARILSVVDAFDALASDRQYRRALPLNEAMGKVEAETGSSFDPAVVAILKRRYIDLEQMAQSSEVLGTKLSTNMRVERGDAPAAGFENSQQPQADFHGSNNSAEFLDAVMTARQDMQLLFDIGESPEQPLRFDEILSVLGVRLKRMIPLDAMAVYLMREDKLVPEFVSGDNFRLFSSLQIPMGQGLSGWVAENRKAIMNGNPSVEPGYLNDPNIFSTLRSALAVPLESAYGDILGVLTVYHEGRDSYTKDHLRLLESLAPKLSHSIEQLSHREVAPEDMATIDALTGLPQARALFLHLESELARCKRLNTTLSVLVCAIDGLKQLNERRGTIEGNRLLRTVAAALKADCREFDYIARMGSAEFVVVLPGVRTDALRSKMSKIMQIANVKGPETLTMLIGEAYFPEDGADAEQLIGEADRRMIRIKHEKRTAAISQQQDTRSADWVQ